MNLVDRLKKASTVIRKKREDGFFRNLRGLRGKSPAILRYTLKNGKRHDVPIYVHRNKEGQMVMDFPLYLKPEDLKIEDKDSSIEPQLVVDPAVDGLYTQHILNIDSLPAGHTLDMVEDGDILYSQRFILALYYAQKRDCKIRVVVGPTTPKAKMQKFYDMKLDDLGIAINAIN